MAISTINSHVARALEFFQKTDIFFALGRTTAWPDDANGYNELDPNFTPPAEDKNTTSLDEIIGYKAIESIYVVVPDDVNGTISYQDSKWRIVPSDQAYTDQAYYIYLETTIRYDELPLGFYRQVGVYSGVVRASGVSTSKANLLPSEVSDSGVLEVYDNRKPSNRQTDQKETLNIVIEF